MLLFVQSQGEDGEHFGDKLLREVSDSSHGQKNYQNENLLNVFIWCEKLFSL